MNQVDSNEFSQQEKLHYFIEGIHPDTRFQVVSKQWSNIEQEIFVASEFDSCKHKQVYPVQMAQNNFHNKHKQISFQNNSNFRKHFNKHDGGKSTYSLNQTRLNHNLLKEWRIKNRKLNAHDAI